LTNAIRLGLVALGLFAAAAAYASNTVVVLNQSSVTIYSMYISSTASNEWGPDQLGEDTIPPSATMTFSDIPCGHYDIRLTNPEGATCDVTNVSICSGAEPWIITDEDLINGCQ
jgi:hypothetical protein